MLGNAARGRRGAGCGALLVVALVALTGCSAAHPPNSAAAPSTAAVPPVRTTPKATAAAQLVPAATPVAATSGTANPVSAKSPGAPPAAEPATTPCAKRIASRFVYVSVRAQHLWLCADGAAAFDSPVTTGAVALPYDATPTGTFRIQARTRDAVLTLNTGRQYTVKYWIPFDAPLFGFHDSPWQQMPYGSHDYRTRGSHGCIHLPLATISRLYRWAPVGTLVRIVA